MTLAPSICGVVLSAGFSTRMGRDKALLPWPPVVEGAVAVNTFLGATIDLLQAFCDLVIVVAGENAPHIAPVTYEHAGFLSVNPQPERGQFSSLRIGLQAVLDQGRDAACIALVDRPPVLPGTVRRLRDAFLEVSPDIWSVVPEVQRDGKPVHGHPILIRREMMEAFLRAPATATAREIEHQHQQHIRYIAVDDPRIAVNIDTPEDYQRLAAGEMVYAERQD